MIVEICDLCKKPVDELSRTEVIIKDYKGIGAVSLIMSFPKKRKFKGVICDDCLHKLRGEEKEMLCNPLLARRIKQCDDLKNSNKTTVHSTEPEDN